MMRPKRYAARAALAESRPGNLADETLADGAVAGEAVESRMAERGTLMAAGLSAAVERAPDRHSSAQKRSVPGFICIRHRAFGGSENHSAHDCRLSGLFGRRHAFDARRDWQNVSVTGACQQSTRLSSRASVRPNEYSMARWHRSKRLDVATNRWLKRAKCCRLEVAAQSGVIDESRMQRAFFAHTQNRVALVDRIGNRRDPANCPRSRSAHHR